MKTQVQKEQPKDNLDEGTTSVPRTKPGGGGGEGDPPTPDPGPGKSK